MSLIYFPDRFWKVLLQTKDLFKIVQEIALKIRWQILAKASQILPKAGKRMPKTARKTGFRGPDLFFIFPFDGSCQG